MSKDTTSYGYTPPLDDAAPERTPPLATPRTPLSAYEGLGSCIHCRRRKVKCDKKTPCANCVRLGFQCELAPRKRAPRRPRKEANGETQSAREVELIQRLNALEGVVKSLGGQAQSDGSRSHADAGICDITRTASLKHGSGGNKNEENKIEEDLGILMLSDEGQSRYVSRNFFARLTEEVDDIKQLVYESSRDNEDLDSPGISASGIEDEGYVFSYSSLAIDLRDLHPLPSQLPFYLKMYAQKVDPCMKLLHIPSMEKFVEETSHNLDTVSRSKEALLFSMYFAVVFSMSPIEVKSNFGFDRSIAINRYLFGVEQALARAGFLDTSDLMTLQAFVLYLSVLRVKEDNRRGWTLTRSAIGIAQSLGLHRDGTAFDLSPFDIEMRRRLWWQICILDFRMAEKHGTSSSILAGSFDTQQPLNINDADISPSDSIFPEPRVGLTEMTLALIGSDFSFASPNLLKSPKDQPLSVVEKEDRIMQFQQLLEERYIKHCTELTPYAWVGSIMPRLAVAKMRTLALLPYIRSISKDPQTKEIRDKLFVTSIETVELRRMLEAETTKQWHWFLGTIIQWHSIAYLLSELCVREPDDSVTRAWNVLDLVFKDWRALREHGAPAILQAPMKKLIARARHKRALDLESARAAEASRLKTPSVMERPQYFDNVGQHFLAPPSIIPDSIPTPYPEAIVPQTSPDDWIEQQVTNNIPTPWLLEDTALQDLGINQTEIPPDMDWELNNWIADFAPDYNEYASFQPLDGW